MSSGHVIEGRISARNQRNLLSQYRYACRLRPGQRRLRMKRTVRQTAYNSLALKITGIRVKYIRCLQIGETRFIRLSRDFSACRQCGQGQQRQHHAKYNA
ncbi:hypothetical protein SDC9_181064 [bioreactor metagenome]|uniref:Uncharacterized protein n=1 Tax=bioreactor metagenome TaxID=1076179 RepID=A0A645H3G2_9ZZZZ